MTKGQVRGIRQWAARPRHGQGVVELALLLPLLALILLGAIDLGRVYIYQTRLNNAVNQAATTGLYQPDQSAVQKRAFREVTDPGILADDSDDRNLLDRPGIDFIIDPLKCYKKVAPTVAVTCTGNPAPGDALAVTGHYTFRPLTSELLRFFPNNLIITKTVRVVY